MLLSIDPGKGSRDSIGWAVFNDSNGLAKMGQATLEEFVALLESLEGITRVVFEEYRIYAKRLKQHTNSKVETIQTIGMIKSWCMRNKIPFTEQRADILGAAQNLFQIKLPEDHDVSHQISALLHGMYFLYMNGEIKSALQEAMDNARN
jgi:hypothetical protein